MAGHDRRTPAAPDGVPPIDRPLLDNEAARRIWDWLLNRHRGQELTAGSQLEDDLGIDSMEWLRLTLEIERRTGIRWTDEAIAQVETVRDLLREISSLSDTGDLAAATFLDEPEASLAPDQRRWLEPLSQREARLATGLHRINRALMRGLFRLRVHGLDRVPDRPVVFAPMHGSFLDPSAVAAALDRKRLARTFWAADTKLAFGNPIIRLVSRLGQAVPFDAESGFVAGMTAAAAVLERGQNLIWFPEGWRSRTGELQEFKPGIGMLLKRFPVPVVPVAIRGAHASLPPGRMVPRPRTIVVGFGEALDPAGLERDGEGAKPEDRITDALRRHTAALSKETGRLRRRRAG